MNKETVLAKLRCTVAFTQQGMGFMREAHYAMHEEFSETVYFRSRAEIWDGFFRKISQDEVNDYFLKLGFPEDRLPRVQLYESYSGSWVIDGAIIMAGTISSVYAFLKGISEIPEIIDGLSELKNRITNKFQRKANERAVGELRQILPKQVVRQQVPERLLDVDFVIDARPLASLSDRAVKAHAIHLSVAISMLSLTVENLGDEPLHNIRIGVFKNKTRQHQWSYADSHMGEIDHLSPHQTIVKSVDDFRKSDGNRLDLADDDPLYVDCWIQDDHGIYLFFFYLERESTAIF